MTCLALWAKGLPKLFCSLIGILAGYAATAAFHIFPHSRPFTLRASLIVGFAILAATTVPVFPDFYRSLPGWTQQFTGSIISMAVVVSVPINAIFLLGTWHNSQLRLGTDSKPATAQSFDEFFERQAKDWKVPAQDAARGRSVVDTAIEDAAANASGNPSGERHLRYFGDAAL
jgi:xanthine/uracil permease